MCQSQDRPLVTFALFTYNQEMFIRQAVEGALAQTYSPLEIILSDDCSTDKTFEVMQDVVSGYTGSHSVTVRRNETNSGLISHFNNVLDLSRGEFVIAAAGDDISVPQRAEKLVKAWEVNGKAPCSVFSDWISIDETGQIIGPGVGVRRYSRNLDQFVKNKHCYVDGCSHGFSADLYRKYGPISSNTIQEDAVISFRAILNAGIVYLDEPLVFYRRHSGNTYLPSNYCKFKEICKSEYAYTIERMNDLERTDGISQHNRTVVKRILVLTAARKFFLARVPGISLLFFFLKKYRLKRRAMSLLERLAISLRDFLFRH